MPEEKELNGADIARETMTGDLRDCLLDFLKHDKNPLPWNMRTQDQQAEIIENATKAASNAVAEAIKIIAADGRSVIVGNLDKVTVKDGIKAEISLSKSDPLRHSLVDSQGEAVLIVIANTSAYEGESKPPLPEPDQRSMLKREEYDQDAA